MSKAITLPEYLRKKKLSQVKFARLVGVSPNTVWRWMKGQARPDWNTMPRLAEITDGEVTANSFLPPSSEAA